MTKQQFFAMLGDLPDEMILHAASPTAETAGAGASADKQATRAARREKWELVTTSGWFIAAVCALVAFGVVFGIVRAGHMSGPEPIGSTAQTSDDTEADETETAEPTAAERLGIDEYHGMKADVPYTLTFTPNGDGTCTLTRVDVNLLYEKPITLVIPSVSPAGDTVTRIDTDSLCLLPLFVEEGEFNLLFKTFADNAGEDSFYYKKVLAYYGGKYGVLSKTNETDPGKLEDLLRAYPIVDKINLWVFDPTASFPERVGASKMLDLYCPQYDAVTVYGYLLSLQAVADANQLPMPMEPADFNAGGCTIEVIELPETLESVSQYALAGCASLKEIRTSMTEEAFRHVLWTDEVPQQLTEEDYRIRTDDGLGLICGQKIMNGSDILSVGRVHIVCGDSEFDLTYPKD